MDNTGMATIQNGDQQITGENINAYQENAIGIENATKLTSDATSKIFGLDKLIGDKYYYYDENGEKQILDKNQYLAKMKQIDEEKQAKADAEAKDKAELEHQEMREDTAYQRMIEDMIKAGINPATVAVSGSGSASSATNQHNATNNEKELEILKRQQAFEALQKELDRKFEKDQNTKNNIWKLITTVIGAGMVIGGKGKK